MATLTEIAAAQLGAQATRLNATVKMVNQVMRVVEMDDRDDSKPEHQGPAKLIDALAIAVDDAIDEFENKLNAMADAIR